MLLVPYVAANALGMVFHPRAVVRFQGSEVEPDLFVRACKDGNPTAWDDAPPPILVVEVLSDSTRRRDHTVKRALYLAAGIPDYWIVDPESRNVRVVRSGGDVTLRGALRWEPAGASSACVISLDELFA
jgi:Uma2 family endonuclease